MTLVETLIGALIFAFVTAGVYMMYTTMQNTMSRGELMSDLQQNARIGLAQMTQEIRMAGYDPQRDSPTGHPRWRWHRRPPSGPRCPGASHSWRMWQGIGHGQSGYL